MEELLNILEKEIAKVISEFNSLKRENLILLEAEKDRLKYIECLLLKLVQMTEDLGLAKDEILELKNDLKKAKEELLYEERRHHSEWSRANRLEAKLKELESKESNK